MCLCLVLWLWALGCLLEAASAGAQVLTASDKTLSPWEFRIHNKPWAELQRGASVFLQEVCPPLPNHHWAGPLSLPEQAPPFSARCPELCAHPDVAKSPGADVAVVCFALSGPYCQTCSLPRTALDTSKGIHPQGTRFPLPISQRRKQRPKEGKQSSLPRAIKGVSAGLDPNCLPFFRAPKLP